MSNRKKIIQAALVLAAVPAFLLIAPIACTSPEKATETLLAQGYSEIEMTGFAFLDCGEGDVFRTAFKAKGPSGKMVEGAVCSGLFKGNTVRLD